MLMMLMLTVQRVKSRREAVDAVLPYKTQSLDDAAVLADTVTLLEAVLSFACQYQQVQTILCLSRCESIPNVLYGI